METLTRVFEFDAAHRIMNERVKCFNLHGHRFRVETTFEYNSKGSLGYAIDFKEIKRVVGDWIDQHFDHAMIANPQDHEVIDLCKKSNWRLWVMGLGRNGDINPTAENIASELFFTISILCCTGVQLKNIRLFETSNCWVDVDKAAYSGLFEFTQNLRLWKERKGTFNYDARCQRKE